MLLTERLVVNLIFFHDLNLTEKNKLPKIIVTNDAPKKESISLYRNCVITGMSIKIPKLSHNIQE